jgi:branched-chain amino acid transport system substrate-binding protein
MVGRLIAFLGIVIALAVPKTGWAAETIKVGAMGPTTGNVATFGVEQKNAYELAVKQINQKGGLQATGQKRKVDLIFNDEQNSPEVGATVARKLINQDHVVAILGPTNTLVCMAAGPIAQSNKVPLVTPTCTNPKVTLIGNYIFRAGFIDTFQGAAGAYFAFHTLGKRRVGILFDNANDYTKGLATYFKEAFEKLGGKVVAFESFTDETKTVDFRPQLIRIKAGNPDLVYSSDYYGASALIAQQMKQLGIKARLMGGDGYDSPDLVKIGGQNVEGVYFTNFYSQEDPRPAVRAFVKAYKATYGTAPGAYAAQAYTAAQILFDAITRAGKLDGPSIRDALVKTKNLTTVGGVISFDKNRNPTKPAAVIEIKGGKQTFVTNIAPNDLPQSVRHLKMQ